MQQRDKIKPILFSIIKHSSPEELRRQIPKDIVAGIVVAVVALPLSIALGIASGVTPEQGLYTAIVAGFLIAFLGGSRVQISGPTAAFATIVAGIVATSGMEGRSPPPSSRVSSSSSWACSRWAASSALCPTP